MNVTELATRENFNVEGYIRFNSDIAEHVRRGGDAWQHFIRHGEKERRSQFSASFLNRRVADGRSKFERFKSVLILDNVRAGRAGASAETISGFRFLEEEGAFPIAFSNQHFCLANYGSESANDTYPLFTEAVTANPDKLFLDLGCGLRRELFENCLYLEVYPSITADIIVAPDCAYPIASNTFDGIGCFAVLEHVTRPWEVATEIRRMLKPGGKCYIDWPFLQPVHGFPSHYYNATRQGLELLFSDGFDLEFCRTEPWQSPAWTIAWVLGKFVNDLPQDKKRKMLKMTVADLIEQRQMGPFWTNLLKDLPEHLTSEFACGNSLVATKR
jgi:SAM-dependent methyltransferase